MNKLNRRQGQSKRRTTQRTRITFDKKEQKYHVTVAGKTNAYGIGSRVPKGSCAYKEERGAWVAITLEDAEQMAKDFASNISDGNLLSDL